jgi:hypothetical protein
MHAARHKEHRIICLKAKGLEIEAARVAVHCETLLFESGHSYWAFAMERSVEPQIS